MYILVEKATGHILAMNTISILGEIMEADDHAEATHGIYPISDADADQMEEGMSYPLLSFDVVNEVLIPEESGHMVKVLNERGNRLYEDVDPIVTNFLRWSGLSPEKQAEWVAYRTALLDITDQPGYPLNVVWPTKP